MKAYKFIFVGRVDYSDKYRILGKIGEGTYGMVFKAEENASPHTSSTVIGAPEIPQRSPPASVHTDQEEKPSVYAIKVVKSHKEGKNDVVLSSATIREIKLLRELHHENIVHLYDVFVDPQEKALALVFEYADHDLHNIIQQSKQQTNRIMSEFTKKSFMHQILKGVQYMHESWVMHRDMKPQNILVVGHGKKRGQVKLADFGLARIYKEPIKALSEVERVVVTLWYRAPELLLGAKHYTKAVDMWAVGCIFAEIINARELFCGKEVEGCNAPFQKDQCDKIFRVIGLPTPHSWEGVEHLPEYPNVLQMARERNYPASSELRNAVKFGVGQSGTALYDLISRLLEYDPEKRLTAKDALQHEYFTSIRPEPKDWAFDEAGKEPVSFRTQTVEPIPEDMLPWKSRNEAKLPLVSDAAKNATENAGGHVQDPPRKRSNSRNRSRSQVTSSAIRESGGRRDRASRNSETNTALRAPHDKFGSRDRYPGSKGGHKRSHEERGNGPGRSPKQRRK